MKRLFTTTIFLVFWSLSLSMAVAGEPKKVEIKEKNEKNEALMSAFEADFTVSDLLKKSPPKKVAILPFINRTKKKEASKLLRRSFFNHFSSLHYKDQELFLTDQIFLEKGVVVEEKMTAQEAVRLGKVLGVDAVIRGEITDYDRLYAVVYSNVSVGMECQMFSTKDGSILWEAKHVVRHHGMGFSIDPISVAITALKNVWQIRDSKFIVLADKLARELVKTIPDSSISGFLEPPKIFSLLHNASHSPIGVGYKMIFQMKGDPKMVAHCKILDMEKDIRLQEKENGEYYGEYTVHKGDNIDEGVLIGYLTNEEGISAQWFDILGKITMDTTPPATPSNIRITNGNLGVQLRWDKVKDPGLASYTIYRSNLPLSGYEKLADIQYQEYLDQEVEEEKNYFYRVSTKDFAQNESGKSDSLQGTLVPKGPTVAASDIRSDTTWHAASGPYIIGKKSITVHSNATLRIEPGTLVLSKHGGLRIRGRFFAEGLPNSRITFKQHKGTKGNVWGGIFFDNTNDHQSRISHAIIKKSLGITIVSSSPKVLNSYLGDNINGFIIKENCSPTIAGNTIENNQFNGIKVHGSSPSITGNTITGNGKTGLLLESGRPLVEKNILSANYGFEIFQKTPKGLPVDISDNYWGSNESTQVALSFWGNFVMKNYYGTEELATLLTYKTPQPLTIKDAEILKKEGDTEFMNQGYEKALSKYQRILVNQKGKHELFFLSGLIHSKKGERIRAVIAFRKAITLEPSQYGYHFNLGLAYKKANMPEKALKSFQETLRLKPNHKKAGQLVRELRGN